MTIKPGQYFMKMKCSGTVYSGQGAGERRGAGATERMDAKLLSCGVFLYPTRFTRGSREAGAPWGRESHRGSGQRQEKTNKREVISL